MTNDVSGDQIGFLGGQNQPKNGFKMQVDQDFSSFFGIFKMIFQSFAAPSTLPKPVKPGLCVPDHLSLIMTSHHQSHLKEKLINYCKKKACF